MTREECNKRISELIAQARELICSGIFEGGEAQKNNDELGELLNYRKIHWPDEYDERTFAEVTDPGEFNFGKTGLVGYVSHNDVEVRFPDGTSRHYHAMSLKKVKSSKELRAIFGEIPESQYFKKRNR